ncbi:MAG: RagB/SusD family nutrient uptake outer membrane protein [Bacteroidaceae bacterium]|nr:RagB/SusD family nutrient uptake outer membrane protein [Bacteroidaceae bacterium]
MNKIIRNIAIAAMAGISVSCSDFLEEYSQDLAKVETWKDLDELLLGDGHFSSSRYYIENYAAYTDQTSNLDIIHFMSDEMKENPNAQKTADRIGYQTRIFPFYTWQKDTGMDEDGKYVGGDAQYWNELYEYINITNIVLSQIDDMPENNQDDKNGKERVKGEACFLRAAYYFMLVNLYAQPYTPATAASTQGVPVKLTEYIEDKEFFRSSVKEVYEYILDDLEQAEKLLDRKARTSIYHPNKVAVNLLQSRVYLYMQDWKKAAEYARKVIDVQPDLLDLHAVSVGKNILSKDSPETIFSMGGYLVAIAFADDPSRWGNEPPVYYVSDDMMKLYQRNDLRSKLYVGKSYAGFSPVFTKVDGQQTAFGTYFDVSDCFLYRTSEAYLTLAEASAYDGDETTAQDFLEKFLDTRLEEKSSVTQTGNELVDFIRDERARELLLEGHRWFDLRRYTVCSPYPYSKTIEHGHVYYDGSDPEYTDYYRLETNDPAYTLPVPREILDFQISLGTQARPDRKPIRKEIY